MNMFQKVLLLPACLFLVVGCSRDSRVEKAL
jgi:hypothetical protein